MYTYIYIYISYYIYICICCVHSSVVQDICYKRDLGVTVQPLAALATVMQGSFCANVQWNCCFTSYYSSKAAMPSFISAIWRKQP